MLSTMRFMFERTKSPLELMRENKRLLERAMREVEREKQSLQIIEKRLIQEIKKAAKLTQMTLKSNEAMAEALQGVIKAVRALNLHVNLPALQKIMLEFEIQHVDLSVDDMEDGDDGYEEEEEEDLEEEEETEEGICQVLDEIGIDPNTVPLRVPEEAEPAPVAARKEERSRIGMDLQTRMNILRGR